MRLYLQIGKTKELFKLDSETSAMIKLRYKDTSKHVIWRNCALPEEYNRGCLVSEHFVANDSAVMFQRLLLSKNLPSLE